MATTTSATRQRPGITLMLLMAAALLSFLDRQVLAFLVEPIKADLRVSDVQISLLQGLAFVTLYSLAAVPFGFLADRGNRHRVIMFGLVSWGSATFACGLADSYGELFAARVLVGLGEATLMPAAYSLISDLFPPERRARAFTLFGSAGIVGVALSFFLGGAVVQHVGASGGVTLPLLGTRSTWQLVFMLAGVPAIVLAGLLLFSHEPRRTGLHGAAADAGWRELGIFFRRRAAALSVLFSAFGLSVFAGYAGLAWMAAAYSRIHGLSVSRAGLACGVIMLLGGFGGVLVGSWIGDRWTRLRRTGGKLMVALVAGLPASICLMLWWSIDDVWYASVLGVLGCSLSFAIGGVGPAALNDMTPNELRGKVSALYLLMTAVVGYALGPFATAYLTEHVFGGGAGLRWSLILVNVAFVAAAIVAWLGRKSYWAAALEQLGPKAASMPAREDTARGTQRNEQLVAAPVHLGK